MKVRFHSLAVVAVATLFCACATTRLSENVEVSLVNLRFQESTVFETTLECAIRMQNQTLEHLSLEGAVHRIYLNGHFIGSGVSNETAEIPRLSEGLHRVKVRLRNLSMIRQVRDILESQRLEYQLQSLVHVRIEGRPAHLRVARTGSLDVKNFQPTRSTP